MEEDFDEDDDGTSLGTADVDEDLVYIYGLQSHIHELRDAAIEFADVIAVLAPMGMPTADLSKRLMRSLRRIKSSYRSFDLAVTGA